MAPPVPLLGVSIGIKQGGASRMTELSPPPAPGHGTVVWFVLVFLGLAVCGGGLFWFKQRRENRLKCATRPLGHASPLDTPPWTRPHTPLWTRHALTHPRGQPHRQPLAWEQGAAFTEPSPPSSPQQLTPRLPFAPPWLAYGSLRNYKDRSCKPCLTGVVGRSTKTGCSTLTAALATTRCEGPHGEGPHDGEEAKRRRVMRGQLEEWRSPRGRGRRRRRRREEELADEGADEGAEAQHVHWYKLFWLT